MLCTGHKSPSLFIFRLKEYKIPKATKKRLFLTLYLFILRRFFSVIFLFQRRMNQMKKHSDNGWLISFNSSCCRCLFDFK